MSNKTLLFGLMLIAALITIDSCKPKSSGEVVPDSLSLDSTLNSPCIVLSEKINNVLYRQYEYDSVSRLTRMIEYSGSVGANRMLKRYTFQYNGAGYLTQFNETNLAERDKSFIYEVDYNPDSSISALRKFKVFNSGPRNTDSLTIVYDDNKRISELQSSADASYKWEYDSLGNPKKWLIRTMTMTQDSTLAEYTAYDTKTNLYAFSKGIQLVNLLMGRAPTRRNILKSKIGTTSYEITYQYNMQNVPTQAIVVTRAIGGIDTSKVETIFSYELKCKK